MSDSVRPYGLQETAKFLSIEFSRQEHWSRLPHPPSGDLPNSTTFELKNKKASYQTMRGSITATCSNMHRRKRHLNNGCFPERWDYRWISSSFAYILVISIIRTCLMKCCCSVTCSMPGFPVLHHLLEFAQTHVHWVSDAIQPSHSLSSPSPPAFNLSQQQSLFQWVSTLQQVAKVLELHLQHQSFQ